MMAGAPQKNPFPLPAEPAEPSLMGIPALWVGIFTWKGAFISKARGNQSSFYNNLDIGTYSMHIHASIK